MNIKQLGIKHKQVAEKEITIVDFNNDVSIVTGESQKGKSAILEIIDYCLFASKNIVPEGVVSTNSNAYVLTLENQKYIINLYRNAKDLKMKMEVLDKPSESEVEIEYNFESITEDKASVQHRFEKLLGINISNVDVKKYNLTSDYKTEKYSIRYQVPFNFLAQNIIANKDVLFRNFSESRYRKRMREQFKLFCGLENLEDYILQQEINKKLQEQKKIEMFYKVNQSEQDQLLLEINIFLEAFNLKKINQIKDFELISSKFESSEDLGGKKDIEYKNCKQRIKELNIKLQQHEMELKNDKYLLSKIKNSTASQENNLNKNDVYCPVCNTKNNSYGKFIAELKESKFLLSNFYAETQIIIEDLEKQILVNSDEVTDLKEKIGKQYRMKQEYEQNKLGGNDAQLFFKRYYELKQKIDIFNYSDSSRIEELKEEIKELKKKQNKNTIKEFQEKLNNNLTSIIQQFDIEDSYFSMPLNFDIKNFDYYFLDGKKKIYINNTGSGANWLSMHLALNISLLKTVKDLDLNSTLLDFIVLDQPTQVYFSNSPDEIGELAKVMEIFESLFEIAKNYKIQLIILEHAQYTNFLHDGEFSKKYEKYEIENWHNTQYGLLPFIAERSEDYE